MGCTFKLDGGASTDYKLLLDLTYLNLERSRNCGYDYLAIYDGQTSTSTQTAKLCGRLSTGQVLKLSSQHGYLKFQSDSSVQTIGFEMRFLKYKPDSTTTCGGTTALTSSASSTKYLYSPGMPTLPNSDQTCTWLITASSGSSVINLEIQYMDLSGGEVCGFDTLKIYDGQDNTGTLLAQVCDSRDMFTQNTVYHYVTSGDKAFLELKTFFFEAERVGFVIAYNDTSSGVTAATEAITTAATSSVCGSVSLSASTTHKFITSPGYPDFYPYHEDCTWLITAGTAQQIVLIVVDTFLEDSESCMADKVTLYDGSSTTYPTLASFCGENTPGNVTSSGNSLLITFKSDGSSNYRGFNIEYYAVVYSTPSCVDSGMNVTELNVTDEVQYLWSENFPSDYNSNTRQYWLLYNPSGEGYIKLDVVDSRIEASYQCTYDVVNIYKGPCQSYPLLGAFCGVEEPTYYQNTGSYVLVEFRSDETQNYRGFNMSYVLTDKLPSDSNTILIVGIVVGSVLGTLALGGLIFAVGKAISKYRASSGLSGSKVSLDSDDEDVRDTRNFVSSKKLTSLKARSNPK